MRQRVLPAGSPGISGGGPAPTVWGSPRERAALALIVGVGLAARAVAIWLTRPEFVGWFNHSYYYWVQVRGLFENGRLPFADMPLLFAIDAATASLFHALGMGIQPAIVNATRMIMSIVPALIAIPFYLLFRSIDGSRPLGRVLWVLVTLSAFLPLTLAYMPEILQKNMAGLLLLAWLMYATHRLLERRSPGALVLVALLFLLIALTHLGTLAVTLLFAWSLLLALLFNGTRPKRAVLTLCLVLAFSAAGLAVVHALDAGAFARIVGYVRSSLSDSLVGRLFSPGTVGSKLLFLSGILLPLAALVFLVKTWREHRGSLPPADRIFWLGNVLLAYLLVAPVLDLDIVPRFILFLPLPLLVILTYHLVYDRRRRLDQLLVGLAIIGVTVTAAGDVTSLVRLDPDKATTYAELLGVRARLDLSRKDLVLTRYGVNTICNWFFGTRAGLITAFNRNDVTSYDRLFVLNPKEEVESREAGAREHLVLTEKQRYRVTRRNVPLPSKLKPRIERDSFEFYELHEIPANWIFDQDGHWIGWRTSP